MAVQAGRQHLGPECGRLILRTFREGLAAQAGHDLTIEVGRWSGEMSVNDESALSELDVRIEMGSLIVREGTGGLRPLSDRDRREIAVTARKVLAADRYPEAKFSADRFEPAANGGGVLSGTLTLHGQTRPIRLEVKQTGTDRYHATASVTQSEYGMKPYSGFLGALKVRDAVNIEIDVDLSKLE